MHSFSRWRAEIEHPKARQKRQSPPEGDGDFFLVWVVSDSFRTPNKPEQWYSIFIAGEIFRNHMLGRISRRLVFRFETCNLILFIKRRLTTKQVKTRIYEVTGVPIVHDTVGRHNSLRVDEGIKCWMHLSRDENGRHVDRGGACYVTPDPIFDEEGAAGKEGQREEMDWKKQKSHPHDYNIITRSVRKPSLAILQVGVEIPFVCFKKRGEVFVFLCIQIL